MANPMRERRRFQILMATACTLASVGALVNVVVSLSHVISEESVGGEDIFRLVIYGVIMLTLGTLAVANYRSAFRTRKRRAPPRMDAFEVVVHGETFRVSERVQPSGAMSYDFAWLNGPADGTYGFTVGPTAGRAEPAHLVAEARGFVEGFYGPGGIGETDFPGHPRPRIRPAPLR